MLILSLLYITGGVSPTVLYFTYFTSTLHLDLLDEDKGLIEVFSAPR